ncbi:MAG: c-type cytochrome, partial [Phycisphaerae bacterium]
LASHTPASREPLDATPIRGETLFSLFCSACHGAEGFGSTMRGGLWPTDADPWGHAWEARSIILQQGRSFELMVPSLNNPDTLAVVSDDALRHTITFGRSGTNMPAWGASQQGGLLPDEIDRLVAFIRSWEPRSPAMDSAGAPRGEARFGRALYQTRCAGCHGFDGGGNSIGVELNSPAFLSVASDAFLRDSIVRGRANTAMPSWKQLSADEVSDLIAYIRSWQPRPPDRQAVIEALAAGGADEDALKEGGELYAARCATCHGADGEGAMGPSLNNDAFLSVVDDDYLYDAIVLGRPGTAMPSWKHLAAPDVANLIRFIRQWNEGRRRSLEPYSAHGDWDRGRILFQGVCAACHGAHAEGASGPQLRNPVFLASASDAMLREWINYGKSATEMRAFLKGHQGVAELSAAQVEDVITYLRRLALEGGTPSARPGLGLVSLGRTIYTETCLGCHGPNAEEPTGSALPNMDFLRAASDGYIQATVVLERSMPQLGLSAEDISNVVAYIRSWEHDPPFEGIPARYVIDADMDAGEELFAAQCAGCHGAEGKDGWAPRLNNPEFLASATDGFLQATIVRGRSNTAMRAFGLGAGGVAELSGEDINNIVAYIRSWAAPENRPSE